jgi:hypothetical protein
MVTPISMVRVRAGVEAPLLHWLAHYFFFGVTAVTSEGGMRNPTEDKKIGLRDGGSVTELLCPRCGSERLHHEVVTVFDREENAGTCIRTHVRRGAVSMESVPSAGSGNPSKRRSGVAIWFSCEGCGSQDNFDALELTIAQQKGSTAIGWRYDPQ